MTKITYVFSIKYFRTFDIHVVSVSRYRLHIFHLDRPILLIGYTLVEQELINLPKHLSSPQYVVAFVRVTRSLVLCVSFVDRCLVILWSVLLRFTNSD
jgi:hypothetical protein